MLVLELHSATAVPVLEGAAEQGPDDDVGQGLDGAAAVLGLEGGAAAVQGPDGGAAAVQGPDGEADTGQGLQRVTVNGVQVIRRYRVCQASDISSVNVREAPCCCCPCH